MNADALLPWIMTFIVSGFMIWLGLRTERRRATLGTLETQEARMARRIAELENTVSTLLIKLNEAQYEVDDLRKQLQKATQRITELEVMYEIAPDQGGVVRLSPKRRTQTGNGETHADTMSADLRKLLTERLADEDLRQIAFDVGGDYAAWSGDTLPVKIASMLSWYTRRGQLGLLLGAIKTARPDIKFEHKP